MDMASSTGYSAVAPVSVSRTVVRWAVLGAAGVIALIIALSNSMTASAAAPVAYQTNCIPINYGTCVQNGVYGTVNNGFYGGGYGAFNGNVVSVTSDNRYCGGVVYIVNEGGNLIDRCPNGARVFPVFPDYGVGGVFGNGFVGNNFIGGNFNNGFVNNGFVNNGAICNGLYGCPGAFNGGFFNNGGFPAGATFVGGNTYTYNDNRFCGDGKLFFVPGRGSFCQNGNGFAGNGFAGNGFVFPNYRFLEVAQPTTATQAPVAVVAPATTAPVAAPVTAAPVAAPTTPVAAPAAVQQSPVVAAPAQMPTALTAPQVQTPDAPAGGGAGIHVLSAPAVTAPAATTDSDDHRG
ncbi:MAG: hypothetical protein M3176_10950 [Chloroflexota bacterium]|nr:hypothetical protein [Chloroflexota bacterium]